MDKIIPKPGDIWEETCKFPEGGIASIVCMFFYEKDEELWGVYLGAPWGAKIIEDDIIDGKNGWRKVHDFNEK